MCIFSFTKTRNLIHYTYDTKLETQNVILYTLRSKISDTLLTLMQSKRVL